jgi:hypothetical protein
MGDAMSRPLCPTCGTPLPKLTTTVWCYDDGANIRQQDSNWSRYLYLPDEQLPRSIADCRRLSNQDVVSVIYRSEYNRETDTFVRGRVSRFTEWDGATYWTASKPFCKPECALVFARLAYQAGMRMDT